MNKASILLNVSEEFKDALTDYAQAQKTTVTALIREKIAELIGYDLSKDVVPDARRKYNSVEERKEAARQRKREQVRNVQRVLEIYNKEQRLRDVLVITNSLKEKGIEVDL